MRKIKFKEVFVPKYRSYLIIIFIILSLLCIAKPTPVIILASILAYILVLTYTYKRHKARIDRVIKNMNSFMPINGEGNDILCHAVEVSHLFPSLAHGERAIGIDRNFGILANNRELHVEVLL